MAQRMGSGIGKTHRQLWTMFRDAYIGDLKDHELREIHNRWVTMAAAVNVKESYGLRSKDATASRPG